MAISNKTGKPDKHIERQCPSCGSPECEELTRYRDHANYFTPKSLQRMAKDSGFEFSLLNPLTLAFNDNVTALLVKN